MVQKLLEYIKKIFSKNKSHDTVRQNQNIASDINTQSKAAQVAKVKKIHIEAIDKLEPTLLEADISYDIVKDILSSIKSGSVNPTKDVANYLLKIIEQSSSDLMERYNSKKTKKPFIILFFGVNGSGKTTTIAKLANLFATQSQNENLKIMLAACDTFRTAACEQLITLKDKVKMGHPNIVIEVESQTKQGEDPSAVCYRATKKSFDENFDVLIVDTSGRLNTNDGLMAELNKIQRTIKKFDQSSPDINVMVIDGSNGSSAISQIEDFSKFVTIDGLIVTKMDSTSKAGALFTIIKKHKQKVFFISNGESLDSIENFNENNFINNLFD